VDARDWDERYAAAPLVWSAGPNGFVEAELTELGPGRALDLACGEGRNALWLAGRGWEVTAVDFSAVAVDKGRRLAAARDLDGQVTWVVGDVLTVPLPAADLALLAYLQLAASERRTAVRRAWDALTAGGTLLVVAHDSTNLVDGTGGPQDPAVLYTAADVLADLHDADLRVLRADRFARSVPPDDDHGGEPERVAWDALVRVVKLS
jgi:SAM-dependent methyltransferase